MRSDNLILPPCVLGWNSSLLQEENDDDDDEADW